MSSTGKLVKMERDYSKEVSDLLPQTEKQAKSGQLQQAIEKLAVLEKQTRNSADLDSNTRILTHIIHLCAMTSQWKVLEEQVVQLSKKHGHLKQAVTKMIQEAVALVDKVTGQEEQIAYIQALRQVTESKIYVEIERARLTMKLSKIYEKEGKINEAADILQELQVETFGSMEKREKTEFILEQMRLNLLKKDFVKMMIVSRKINTKYFQDVAVQDLKLRYYELMIQLASNDGNYLDICKYYRQVYDTKSVQEDDLKWKEILRFIVQFIILSPFDNEQSDLIHRINLEKKLDQMPLYRQVMTAFTTKELMRFSKIEEIYKQEFQKYFVFSPQTQEGQKRWKDLHKRVTEHNIRVISQYYKRLTLKRLTELLDLSLKESEEILTQLVSNGTIYAKIDRVSGIIVFYKQNKPAVEVLNRWSSNISSLLNLLAKTTHVIAKEEMLRKFGPSNDSMAVGQ